MNTNNTIPIIIATSIVLCIITIITGGISNRDCFNEELTNSTNYGKSSYECKALVREV